MKQLLVQSHRGGGLFLPENTIESFLETWNAGAVPEADLRTTSDGVIVAFHDESFARVVKDMTSDLQEKGIKDVTFEELSAFDVGSWKGDKFAGQHICSLAEIFTMMRGYSDRFLYMDIKDVKLSQLAELVRKFEVTEQVILAAPDEQLLREWKHIVPQSPTLLWMGIPGNGDEEMLLHRLERLREEDFYGITQLQIHVEAIRNNGDWQFKPTLKFLRTIATDLGSCGVLFQSLPWECGEAEVYRRLLEAGVQSFASDYPEVALGVLREWTEFHPRSE